MSVALLAYLQEFMTQQRSERINEVLARRTNHFTVCIEDVYQLHNTSAVLRSCDVFGIQQLHVIEAQFGKRLDKNIAMGSEKWVDVHRYDSTKACMARLKAQGYQIIASSPHHTAHSLSAFDISKKSAICFGTERTGLSEEVLSQADGFIHIPMEGFTESLNISVSAAIILHELRRRLNESSIPWQLTPEELLDKRIDWSKKSIRSIEDVLRRFEQGN